MCSPLRTEAWEEECDGQRRRGKEDKEGMIRTYRGSWAHDEERVRLVNTGLSALVVGACAHGAVQVDLHDGLAEVARRRVARGHRGRGCRLRHGEEYGKKVLLLACGSSRCAPRPPAANPSKSGFLMWFHSWFG
jgi:hypothetical protein